MEKQQKFRKVISTLLAVAMIVNSLPVSVWATLPDSTENTIPSSQTEETETPEEESGKESPEPEKPAEETEKSEEDSEEETDNEFQQPDEEKEETKDSEETDEDVEPTDPESPKPEEDTKEEADLGQPPVEEEKPEEVVPVPPVEQVVNNEGTTTSHLHYREEWVLWDTADALPADAGKYCLNTNVTLTDTWYVDSNEEMYLCLNGHNITMAEAENITDKTYVDSVIRIKSGNKLYISDCTADNDVNATGHIGGVSGCSIYVEKEALLDLRQINIGDNKSVEYVDASGETVYTRGTGIVNNGTFEMYSGRIADNVNLRSAGAVENRGIFKMYGGKIDNNSGRASGAIVNSESAKFIMFGGVIENNHSENRAGAILNDTDNNGNKGIVELYYGRIKDNSGREGGAINNVGDMLIEGTMIYRNMASERGGAIYNSEGAKLVIAAANLYNNRVGKDTGEVDENDNPIIELAGEGGALSNMGETKIYWDPVSNDPAAWTTIRGEEAVSAPPNWEPRNTQTFFAGNRAARGGAIANVGGGKLTINGGYFQDNHVSERGGFLFNGSSADEENPENTVISVAELNDLRITNNHSENEGGAIHNRGNAKLSINGGYHFKDNSAEGCGGFLYNSSTEPVTINRAHLNNNEAGENGGAIYNRTGATINIGSGVVLNSNIANEGGGIYNQGNLTIDPLSNTVEGEIGYGEIRFEDNHAYKNGGAIFNTKTVHDDGSIENATMTIKGGIFKRNHADKNGGAIVCNDSNMTISGGTFEENTAQTGGAIVSWNDDENLTLNISGTENDPIVFTKNEANGEGAAISLHNSSSLILVHANFSENYANQGAAIFLADSSEVTINGGNFSGNQANQGSVVYSLAETTLTIKGGNFTGNQANQGAVIYSKDGAVLTINGGEFKNNKGRDAGGVIYSTDNVALTISGGTFEGNYAHHNGGVIVNEGNTSLMIGGGTFTENFAESCGSVLFNNSEKIVQISGGEFVNNGSYTPSEEEGSGVWTTENGVIFNEKESSIEITKATFTDNRSDFGGAIYNKGTVKVGTDLDKTPADPNVLFSGNFAIYLGGAIYNENHMDLFCDVKASGNWAENGGAIYNEGYMGLNGAALLDNKAPDGAEPTCFGGAISNCGKIVVQPDVKISGNEADHGGAVYNNGELIIHGGIFDENFARERGGFLLNESPEANEDNPNPKRAVVSIYGGSFCSNQSGTNREDSWGVGGVIMNCYNGIVEVYDGTFEDSRAKQGAVFYNQLDRDENDNPMEGIFSELYIYGGTYKNNTAEYEGAVLFNQQDASISGTYEDENGAQKSGKVMFSGNQAMDGGVVYNEGELKVFDAEMTGNKAIRGAGLANNGYAEILSANITGNSAIWGAGIHNDGELVLHGTAASPVNIKNNSGVNEQWGVEGAEYNDHPNFTDGVGINSCGTLVIYDYVNIVDNVGTNYGRTDDEGNHPTEPSNIFLDEGCRITVPKGETFKGNIGVRVGTDYGLYQLTEGWGESSGTITFDRNADQYTLKDGEWFLIKDSGVYGVTGKTEAGATVQIFTDFSEEPIAEVTAGETGSYSIGNLYSGWFRLRAEKDGFAPRMEVVYVHEDEAQVLAEGESVDMASYTEIVMNEGMPLTISEVAALPALLAAGEDESTLPEKYITVDMKMYRPTTVRYNRSGKDWVALSVNRDIETFAPQSTQNSADHEILSNLYDGLLEMNQSNKLVPALAASYEHNEDSTVWTFTLRDNLVWTDVDGNVRAELDAWDFVTAVEWTLNPHKNRDNANVEMLFDTLKGAREYHEAMISVNEEEAMYNDYMSANSLFMQTVGISVSEDGKTITFTCPQSTPYFDSMTVSAAMMPLSQKLIDQIGVDGIWHMDNWAMWYCGPYRMTHNEYEGYKMLEPNPVYWDGASTRMKQVLYYPADASTAFDMFDNGEIDYVKLNEDDLADIMNNPYDRYFNKINQAQKRPYSYVWYWNFDKLTTDGAEDTNWNKAIANRDFRRSIYYGLNLYDYYQLRDPIDPMAVENDFYTMDGLAFTGNGTDYTELVRQNLKIGQYNGKTMARSKDVTTYISNAKTALAAQGVTFPIHLEYHVKPGAALAEKLANAVKEAAQDLGDNYLVVDIVECGDNCSEEKEAFRMKGWAADYADPLSFLTSGEMGIEEGSSVYGTYNTFMGKVNVANALTDKDERYAALAEAEAYLIDEGLLLPSHYVTGYCLTRIDVSTQVASKYGSMNNSRVKNWIVYDSPILSTLEIPDPDNAEMSGTITDIETGAAIAGANVQLYKVDEYGNMITAMSAVTDENGSYSIEKTYVDDYYYHVSAEGYAAEEDYFSIENRNAVEMNFRLYPLKAVNTNEGKTNLVLPVSSQPDTFNVLTSTTVTTGNILSNLYDSLLALNSNEQLVPSLADSLPVHTTDEEGNSVWTFTLRNNLAWVDLNGTVRAELTVEDFATSLEWVLNHHKNYGENASMAIENIKGAEAYYNMTEGMSEEEARALKGSSEEFLNAVGIAIDEEAQTISYTCKGANAYFDTLAVTAILHPLSQKLVDQIGVEGVQSMTNWQMWYCGPYIMTNFMPGESMDLVANPVYWDQTSTRMESISFRLMDNWDAYYAFRNGEVDVATLDEDMIYDILRNPNDPYYKKIVPMSNSFTNYQWHWNFNKMTEAGELDHNWNKAIANTAFRQSIYYGFNLYQILASQNPVDPLASENNSYTMPGLISTTDGTDYTDLVRQELLTDKFISESAVEGATLRYNEEKAAVLKEQAKKELAELGVEFPVKLYYYVNPGNTVAMNNGLEIERVLEKCLGEDYINVRVKEMDIFQAREQGVYSVINNGWIADYADPMNTIGQEISSGYYADVSGLPKLRENNPPFAADVINIYNSFEGKIEAANAIVEKDARYAAFAEAEAYWIENGLTLPVNFNTGYCLTNVEPSTRVAAMYGSLSNMKVKNWLVRSEAINGVDPSTFPQADAMTVSGIVTNTDGAPIAGAAVKLYLDNGDRETYSATTDADGKYTIENVYYGNYRHFVSAENYLGRSSLFEIMDPSDLGEDALLTVNVDLPPYNEVKVKTGEDLKETVGIGVETFPETMNILNSEAAHNNRVLCNIWDGMLEVNTDNQLITAMAQTYDHKVDANGNSVWSFTLKDDLFWVDNNNVVQAEITAWDFATSMEWVLNPSKNYGQNSDLARQMIQGAEAYYSYVEEFVETDFNAARELNAHSKEFLSRVGISISDDGRSISYTCIGTKPYFDTMGTHQVLYPLSQAMVDQFENLDDINDAMDCNKMWYCGPYVAKQFGWDSSIIVLEPNLAYWDKECTRMKQVTYYLTNSSDEAYDLFTEDLIDKVNLYEGDINEIINNPNHEFYNNIMPTTLNSYSYQWHWNYDKQVRNDSGKLVEDENWNKAIANENFRKAIYYGLDLTQYYQRTTTISPLLAENNCYTMKGLVYTTNGTDYTDLVKTELGLKTPDYKTMVRYDAAKAQEAMNKAVEELTAIGVTFPVRIDHYVQGSGNEDIAKLLKELMERDFGNKVNVDGKVVDFVELNICTYEGSMAQNVRIPRLMSFINNGWGADYADPMNFLSQEICYTESGEIYGDAMYSTSYSYVHNAFEKEWAADLKALYSEFSRLVWEADKIIEKDARLAAFAKAEAYLIDHGLVMPLSYNEGYCVTRIDPDSQVKSMFGNSNHRVKNWTVAATPYISNSDILTMPEAGELTITLEEVEGGTLIRTTPEEGAPVKAGDVITIKAAPDTNWNLETLYVDGKQINGNTFIASKDHVVSAVFVKNYIARGYCELNGGKGMIWTLYNDGHMHITGNGNMISWESGGSPWYAYRGLIKRVTIEAGVKNVGDYAFEACTNLTSVDFLDPDPMASMFVSARTMRTYQVRNVTGVTSIGEGAFKGCTALSAVELPSNVETIETAAFEECSALSSVVIPETVTSIEVNAFASCESIETVFYSGAMNGLNNVTEETGNEALITKQIPDTSKENTYSVKITAANNGTVTASPAIFKEGRSEEITLTITPADGYKLQNLNVDGSIIAAEAISDNKYTFTADGTKDYQISATFVPANGGSVISGVIKDIGKSASNAVAVTLTSSGTESSNAVTVTAYPDGVYVYSISGIKAGDYQLQIAAQNGANFVTYNETITVAAESGEMEQEEITVLKKGDINSDGKVDLNDVDLLFRTFESYKEIEGYDKVIANIQDSSADSGITMNDVDLLFRTFDSLNKGVGAN